MYTIHTENECILLDDQFHKVWEQKQLETMQYQSVNHIMDYNSQEIEQFQHDQFGMCFN